MRVGVAALREAPTPVQPNMAGACAQCNANQGGRRGKANTDHVAHMHRLKLSSILFWFLAAVSAALLVALALIVGGVIPIDPASQPPGDLPTRWSSRSRRPSLGPPPGSRSA